MPRERWTALERLHRRDSIAILRRDPFSFRADVASSRRQVRELFNPAARPRDNSALHPGPLLQTKRNREFGLRQIRGTAFHHARLTQLSRDHANGCANAVAV